MQIPLKTPKFSILLERVTVAIILLIGMVLRLRQYLTGRSLWLDEAMLALNIVNRDFSGLFKPLEYNQGAPIGFLIGEKFFTSILGIHEYVLRLFPLLLGITALWIFYHILRRINYGIRYVTLAIFAFNPILIYYSSEGKQYIADVFAVTLLIFWTIKYLENPERQHFQALMVAGILTLWLSHPSIFILAGIGTSLALSNIQKRKHHSLIPLIIMGTAWLVNIGTLYFFNLEALKSNSFMQEYWAEAFAPMPFWSHWEWYWGNLQSNISFLFSISDFSWIFSLFILTGLILLFRQNQVLAMSFLWTFIFAFIASSLKLYPSHGRLSLYLLPIAILAISSVLEFPLRIYPNKRVISTLIISFMSIFLLWGSSSTAMEQFLSPKYFEHIRPSMKYLQRSWQPGDKLFVSHGGVPAFRFYASIYGLDDISFSSNNEKDISDLISKAEILEGNSRVWFLFSHVYENESFNEREFLVDYLKKNGRKLNEYSEPGTSVFLYLFDLSQ